MKDKIDYAVPIADGVQVSVDNGMVTVKGPKGETSRPLRAPKIRIEVADKKVSIKADNATKREKMHAGTISAHIKNMIKGVQQPFVYELKACHSHFPMNVSVSGDQLIVKNFLGEKTLRTIKFDKQAKVVVSGDKITVESCNLEAAGTTASKFEGLTFINKRDRRVFQDGIYITIKPKVKE